MKIKNASDKELLTNVKCLVAEERLTLERILEHLEEIQRRRLFADLGYSSLFKYLVKELKYSESAAARRVAALRLVNKVPEAKIMIAKGELNLTTALQAQNFTKEKDAEKTLQVLKLVKGKSKDEVTVELMKMAEGDNAEKGPS